jgi:hypothetical protein
LKRQGVTFHTTNNRDMKGAIVERFNKTLKTNMYTYLTKNDIPLLGRYKYSYNRLQRLCAFRYVYTTEQSQPLKYLICVAKGA